MPLKRSRPVRTRICIKVEVRSSRQSFEAEARDVSVLGLCLCSPILMPIGDRAGASLRFQSGEELPLPIEVRWARPEGAKHYLLGVEFVHTPETLKAMQSLMWQIESGLLRGDDPARKTSPPPPRFR